MPIQPEWKTSSKFAPVSLRLAGIFGRRMPEIPKALISACRTRQNAEPGRPVPKVLILTVPIPLIHPALTVRIHTVLTPLILLALTKWFPCWAPAVISCTKILPTPQFIATAR